MRSVLIVRLGSMTSRGNFEFAKRTTKLFVKVSYSPRLGSTQVETTNFFKSNSARTEHLYYIRSKELIYMDANDIIIPDKESI